MNELKTRFLQLAEYYGISIRKLEDKFELSRGNVSNIKGAIGSDKLSKIHDSCPEVNLIWLITGSGNMIFNENEFQQPVIKPDELSLNVLLDRIESLSAKNERLKEENHRLKSKTNPGINLAAEPEDNY